jgi:hypothetical protein
MSYLSLQDIHKAMSEGRDLPYMTLETLLEI